MATNIGALSMSLDLRQFMQQAEQAEARLKQMETQQHIVRLAIAAPDTSALAQAERALTAAQAAASQERIAASKNESAQRIAEATRASREMTAAANLTSREQIAASRNTAMQTVAAERTAAQQAAAAMTAGSRERIAAANAESRERIAAANNAAKAERDAARGNTGGGGGGNPLSLLGGGVSAGPLILLAGVAAAAKAAQMAISALWEGGKDAVIGYNDQLDRGKVAMASFLGSEEKASAYVKELLDLANSTPFSFEQVEKGAIRFLNMGLSAQQAKALIIDVGNAVAKVGGTSEQVDRATLAISQLGAKGKVSAQDLNQLGDVGINGFDILAKHMHTTEAAARKMSETVGIQSSVFIQAFHEYGQMPDVAGAMEKQSHTFTGAMSTITDALKLAGATAFRPFFDGIVSLANKIAAFVTTPWFNNFVTHVSAAVTAAMGVLRSFLDFLAPVGKAILAALGVDTAGLSAQIEDAMKNAKVPSSAGIEMPTTAANTAAEATKQYTDANHELNAELLTQRQRLDSINDALHKNREEQQDIKDRYAPQIRGLERQARDTHDQYDPLIAQNERAVRDAGRIYQGQQQANALQQRDVRDQYDPLIAENDRAIRDAGREHQRQAHANAMQQRDVRDEYDPKIAENDRAIRDAGRMYRDQEQTNARAQRDVRDLYDPLIAQNERAMRDAGRVYRDQEQANARQQRDVHDQYDPKIAENERRMRDAGRDYQRQEQTNARAQRDVRDEYDPQIAANERTIRDTQATYQPRIADKERAIRDIQEQFKPLIAEKERLIRDLNRPTQYDLGLTAKKGELDARKIQIELAKPDTSQYEAAIEHLQDVGRHIGDGTLDAFAAHIEETRDKIEKLGAASTRTYDVEIHRLRAEMDSIVGDKSLDRRIQDLQRQVAAPALDTSGYRNQLAVLAAQGQGGADVGAQYAAVSGQLTAATRADAAKRAAQKTELQQLQERQVIQRHMDEDHRASLEHQIKIQEGAKQSVVDQNNAARDALQVELRGWEDKKAAQEKTNAAARKANADAIDAQNDLKRAALSQYETQMKAVDADLKRVGLLQEQARLVRETKVAPIQRSLDGLRDAEADRIAPLQAEADKLKRTMDDIIAPVQRTNELLKNTRDDVLRPLQVEAEALKRSYQDALEPLQRQTDLLKDQRDDKLRPLQEAAEKLKREYQDALDPLQRQTDLLKDTRDDKLRPLQAAAETLKREYEAFIGPLQRQNDLWKDQRDDKLLPLQAAAEKLKREYEAFITPLQSQNDLWKDTRDDKLRPLQADAEKLKREYEAFIGPLQRQVDVWKDLRDDKLMGITTQLETIKRAQEAELAPLLEQEHSLSRQATQLQQEITLNERKIQQNNVIIQQIKDQAIVPPPKPPGGGGDSGYVGMTNPADMARTVAAPVDSPLVKWLNDRKKDIDDLTSSKEWKTLTNPDASGWERLGAAYALTLGKLDKRINESVTNDDWHMLLFGTHANGQPATTGEQWGALDRTLDDALKGFDKKLRQNNIPVTWGDWWERIKQTFGVGVIGSQDIYDEFGNKLVDSSKVKQNAMKAMWGTWWGDLDRDAKIRTATLTKTVSDWWDGLDGDAKTRTTTLTTTIANWWIGLDTDAKTRTATLTTTVGTWWSNMDTDAKTRTTVLTTTISNWWIGLDTDAKVRTATLVTTIGSAFSGLGAAISTNLKGGLQGALNLVGDFVHGVQHAVNAIGEKFGQGQLAGADWPVPQLTAAAAAAPSGPGARNEATGTRNFPGGAAFIGEAGRELYTVGDRTYLADKPTLLTLPAGSVVYNNAETERILSNTAVSGGGRGAGPVDGIKDAWSATQSAVGGFFSNLGSSAQNIKQQATTALTGALGGLQMPDLPGVLKGVGPAIAEKIKSTVTEGIKGLLAPFGGTTNTPGVSGNASGPLATIIDSLTSDPHVRQSMKMAALMEGGGLTGPWPDQIGGGPGRGPFQIEAETRYHMDISQADARDPALAAAYMLPDFARNVPKVPGELWERDPKRASALGAYYSERPAEMYDDPRIDRAWAALMGAAGAGTTANVSGGYPSVLAQAVAALGDTGWGSGFDTLCEGFAEQMERNAGFDEGRWPSAAAHGYGVSHDKGWPAPPGAMAHWGTGYFPVYGHAGISTGDGSIIGTTMAGTIQKYDMGGKADYLGWLPPGLANGGITVGGNPFPVIVGDGPQGEREIHAPEPVMRAVVRDALREGRDEGGGTVTFHAGAIVIHAAPGMDERELAERVAKLVGKSVARDRERRG